MLMLATPRECVLQQDMTKLVHLASLLVNYGHCFTGRYLYMSLINENVLEVRGAKFLNFLIDFKQVRTLLVENNVEFPLV